MRIIILAVAAIAAVLAAFLVRNMASAPEPLTATETVERIVEVEVSQQKVLVAMNDLRAGSLITPDVLRWADWPEAAINPGYFTQEVAPDAMETISGSVVRVATYADEPILPQKIVQKGETGFMAALLKPGFRAAAVEISPESASAGFILPDDRVDVILTQEIEFTNGETLEERTVTSTILENVRILAIDQSFGDMDGIPTLTGSTATMELTSRQAELMALAARSGTVSLTLRSVADVDFNDGFALEKEGALDAVDQGGGVVVYRSGKPAAGGSL
ncbi:MAG: Flp pilus assembly protein CpaB [Henriciella sp.]|nr:Flp pilus assembly protein CpaB [Henriciella sp.]